MAKQERRDGLAIRQLSLEHLDQYNQLLRYVFQVTNRDLVNSGYEEGELLRSKRPVLEHANVIGWFSEDKLVSQLSVYPCQVNIHGVIMHMGGLTGVGTYPEYANLGLMSELIKVGLAGMRERGEWISYLYPYSIPFYRKKGWEIMSERMTFSILDSQLPKTREVSGYIERRDVDDTDVFETYDRYARNNHGAMLRGKIEWEEYWRWENEEERTAAVYYDQQARPAGYMLYWIARDVFHIKEMIYLNQEARVGLWNFVTAHYSMIDRVQGNVFRNDPIAFLMDDSQIQESIEPYFMARIVDVAAFLEQYPFTGPAEPFHFVVTDPVAEWNSGVFCVSREGEKLRVSREPMGGAVILDIGTLTAMLMSFRKPSYFHLIERMRTDPRTLAVLESAVPQSIPYFSDYF